MLPNLLIYSNFFIALLCLIFIYILSRKQDQSPIINENSHKKTHFKMILYYDSFNQLNLTFLESTWKQIIFKYNKYSSFSFSHIDIYKNKYFKNYVFESSPTIYIIIDDHNLIYKYNGDMTFNTIENFMMMIGSLIV